MINDDKTCKIEGAGKPINQTQYKVIRDSDNKDFQIKVQRYLDDGWKLQGDVSVGTIQSSLIYVQSLIKD